MSKHTHTHTHAINISDTIYLFVLIARTILKVSFLYSRVCLMFIYVQCHVVAMFSIRSTQAREVNIFIRRKSRTLGNLNTLSSSNKTFMEEFHSTRINGKYGELEQPAHCLSSSARQHQMLKRKTWEQ